MSAPPPPQSLNWDTQRVFSGKKDDYEYYRGYGGGPSDFDIWLGASGPDGCHSQQAFGTVAESERQCGTIVARGGTVLAPDAETPVGTMIANGRNPLFLRTFTHSREVNKGVIRETHLAMKMLASTDNPKALCSYAGVFRQGYWDGLNDIPIAHAADPYGGMMQNFDTRLMLKVGEEGNEFIVTPQALMYAREAPYPKLKLIAMPFQIDLMRTPKKCSKVELTKNKTMVCYKTNVTSTQLDNIAFSVEVRTEPKLAPQFPEIIKNCDYAKALDERKWVQPMDDIEPSAAAINPGASSSGMLALSACVATWLARRRGGGR